MILRPDMRVFATTKTKRMNIMLAPLKIYCSTKVEIASSGCIVSSPTQR